MIEGFVNANYEPVITLAVQGPSGRSQDIEAVVDTGFNGFLTLPPALVVDLGLTFQSEGWATLANGVRKLSASMALRCSGTANQDILMPTRWDRRRSLGCCSWTGMT